MTRVALVGATGRMGTAIVREVVRANVVDALDNIARALWAIARGLDAIAVAVSPYDENGRPRT